MHSSYVTHNGEQLQVKFLTKQIIQCMALNPQLNETLYYVCRHGIKLLEYRDTLLSMSRMNKVTNLYNENAVHNNYTIIIKLTKFTRYPRELPLHLSLTSPGIVLPIKLCLPTTNWSCCLALVSGKNITIIVQWVGGNTFKSRCFQVKLATLTKHEIRTRNSNYLSKYPLILQLPIGWI